MVAEDWKRLIENRVKELGSLQKVADEIGYARCSLSLALRDKYVGKTDRLIAAVHNKLNTFDCPHLQRELSSSECKQFKERDAPTQNPLEMRHWRACQACPVQCHGGKKHG